MTQDSGMRQEVGTKQGSGMTHGSLFSGIGGADLAAQWAGWENLFHCEINPFGRKVLEYYWPKSKSYADIKQTDFTIWRGRIDVLTGGFPCQPFSAAGLRKGTEDDRHLWPEMLRAIREIQPRYIVGENVRGFTNWGGVWYSTRCNLTWKMRATKSSRFYFQLAVSMPRTEGTESGLLPTPTVQDFKRRGPNSKQQGLSNTENWANQMLPTPTANAWKGGRTAEGLEKAGRNQTNSLPDFFAQTGKISQLNPQFVSEMMGFPHSWTLIPFLDQSELSTQDNQQSDSLNGETNQ